jgi:hypothetical protein
VVASLAGVMGQLSVRQGLVSGLDTSVGNARRRQSPERNRAASESLGGSGGFLVVKELAFGVDERTCLHELSHGDSWRVDETYVLRNPPGELAYTSAEVLYRGATCSASCN